MERMEELTKTLTRLGKDKPKELNSFMNFMKEVEGGGVIDKKNKALILISLAVNSQCGWCITAHVAGAVKAKASKEEILDASMLAVVMGCGPKMMYMSMVYEELDKYFK